LLGAGIINLTLRQFGSTYFLDSAFP